MQPTMRPYRSDDDYWRIRSFLSYVFERNHRREINWTLARFDYWFWAGVNVFEKDWFQLDKHILLWELEDGQITAVLNPEGRGDAFLQVHPDFCTPELEREMLLAAEKYLAEPLPGGKKRLRVWTIETDDQRRLLLKALGYRKSDSPEYMRRRSLDLPILEAPLPPGFTIRALRWPEDIQARSLAGWMAFQGEATPVDPRYESGEWYKIFQKIPIYRNDLELVVTAPDGEIAAFCTVWYEEANHTGYFEPVGTVPTYQRKGLGKAVMCEGLRRLKALGTDLALVGSYSPEAGALYASVGFTEYELLESWEKEMDSIASSKAE
ncbi:MAG: GNAT family N-acetyltransferase [Chloroflexi bacterium]|nr:MAG: GNAT family N-acetyltransferase [Chloroflexota bacterium]